MKSSKKFASIFCICFLFLMANNSVAQLLGDDPETGEAPVLSPIGVISNLLFHVNYEPVIPDENDVITFDQPNVINISANCYCEVPFWYPGPVNFHCMWTLFEVAENEDQSKNWKPTLNPNENDERTRGVGREMAVGQFIGSVTIWGDGIKLAEEIVTFNGQ
jgi:hypothetical protein